MSNAAKQNPRVRIDLGGKMRELECSHAAMAAMEESMPGLSCYKGTLWMDFYDNPTIFKIGIILWALLLESEPQLDGSTPDARRQRQKDIIKLINFENQGMILEKISLALERYMPKKEEPAPEEPESEGSSEDPLKPSSGQTAEPTGPS